MAVAFPHLQQPGKANGKFALELVTADFDADKNFVAVTAASPSYVAAEPGKTCADGLAVAIPPVPVKPASAICSALRFGIIMADDQFKQYTTKKQLKKLLKLILEHAQGTGRGGTACRDSARRSGTVRTEYPKKHSPTRHVELEVPQHSPGMHFGQPSQKTP